MQSVSVEITQECKHVESYPHIEMDESYELEVSSSGAFIHANETWGAMRGMETLSQLVYPVHHRQLRINLTRIADNPLFPHRGILLDTARHFISKETIIQLLESMAMNKMNVFHWHIVDEQSFPYQSAVFPALSDRGAYDPVTKIYTASDIREIIHEARLRGIRVIPEFDTPGHTRSWGLGHPELLTPCYGEIEKDGFYGPLNPVADSTFSFLEKLFTEVMQVFKDERIHIGGDEVPLRCWASNPSIQNFTIKGNITKIKSVYHHFEERYAPYLRIYIACILSVGGGAIVWEEAFSSGAKLHEDTIIQLWKGSSLFGTAIAKGYRVLTSSCWYLDHMELDFASFYRCRELPYGAFLTMQRLSDQWLGGEAAMWTEHVDEEGLLSRIWPRASATAERLWRPVNQTFYPAGPRMEEQRCRMLR
ncbi:hypothetical protein CAPTEDRAFT_115968 [Capitella teleta]|uniref:beta-N-acetylhexosaminidase n=1 Tax=Capitella teleta TaxID=283909 RepID=R7UI75_CAPTE|nr:hypothetical protein CAPTEDRAFT_115968 [Capitella teleta]|eukprot:ELU06264.1 hypothetical protein CAPTEDRAFT_115968 [Capitella teleta]